MKQRLALVLLICLAVILTACGDSAESEGPVEPVEIQVFAAASLQESLNAVIEDYWEVAHDVTVIATYDSSGALLKQIKEGAPCDLFLSAAPKQIDALDGSLIGNAERNPAGLDLIVEGTRLDLLENKVTLAVPNGNPAGVKSFDHLVDLLEHGEVLLAVGNSDVPVGQYTQKIFTYYGIDEAAVSDKLTYGSNAKEVTTQILEAAVDCGIIYGTDAFSAGLTIVDEATAEMCGQVLYPVAVINSGTQTEAAQAFLNYLCTTDAKGCFEAVGFSPLA